MKALDAIRREGKKRLPINKTFLSKKIKCPQEKE
jgi:hypothetical protein